ncbi:MAG: hypothetical protein IJG57_05615 [Firmicutes bacterium]|nr:hypothetical protein [Bacillota bacterium]
MRTQDEKLRISLVVMVLSILLVIFMLLAQIHPETGNNSSAAPENAAASAVLPVSAEELYSQAEKYSGSGDYLGALKALAQIDETWPQYAQASNLIKECEEKLLAEVSSPATIEEYLECERKVNEYLEVRSSPAFLERKKQLVADRDAFIAAASVIETASAEFESGEYSAALETLENALESSGTNRFISAKLEEYRSIYVAAVTEEAEAEIENRNYTTALAIVDEALEVCDCEELREVRKHVLEEADPFYGVYNDLRDSASEWWDSWTEDSDPAGSLFDYWFSVPETDGQTIL